jgi:copper homeostasis protein CutC
MRAEADAVLAEDVAGIVIGALRVDGQIDERRTFDRFCSTAAPAKFTLAAVSLWTIQWHFGVHRFR